MKIFLKAIKYFRLGVLMIKAKKRSHLPHSQEEENCIYRDMFLSDLPVLRLIAAGFSRTVTSLACHGQKIEGDLQDWLVLLCREANLLSGKARRCQGIPFKAIGSSLTGYRHSWGIPLNQRS